MILSGSSSVLYSFFKISLCIWFIKSFQVLEVSKFLAEIDIAILVISCYLNVSVSFQFLKAKKLIHIHQHKTVQVKTRSNKPRQVKTYTLHLTPYT